MNIWYGAKTLAPPYSLGMEKKSPADLNFLQAAAASGLDASDFTKLAKRVGFRGHPGKHNERLISRDELAHLTGRVLTDAEFERARKVKSKITGLKEKEV